MFHYLLQPLRQLAVALLAFDSPRQLAAGWTIGMVLGLVPKDNLIAVALGVLLCALRVNRIAGVASAALFSLISPTLDSVSHLIGSKLLNEAALQPTWAWLYETPLGPWIGFHNTVVMGSLLLGLYFTYPCYWVTRTLTSRYRSAVAGWIARHRVTRWLSGAQLASRLGG